MTATPTCQTCRRPYATPYGCDPLPAALAGRKYPPTLYGQEDTWAALDITPPPTCRDCATPLGHAHHTHCCIEACPRCGGQAIACPCHEEDSC